MGHAVAARFFLSLSLYICLFSVPSHLCLFGSLTPQWGLGINAGVVNFTHTPDSPLSLGCIIITPLHPANNTPPPSRAHTTEPSLHPSRDGDFAEARDGRLNSIRGWRDEPIVALMRKNARCSERSDGRSCVREQRRAYSARCPNASLPYTHVRAVTSGPNRAFPHSFSIVTW